MQFKILPFIKPENLGFSLFRHLFKVLPKKPFNEREEVDQTAILTFLFSSVVNNYAFRCGDGKRNLASEGQHKYQILKDCGPPVSKEIVGGDENGNAYRIVEEWLYIINERGSKQVYLIKFDDKGIAVKIDWLGKQK